MHRFLLLLVFGAVFSNGSGQSLTGKWVGYFKPNTDVDGNYFPYELIIRENAKHELIVEATTQFPNFKLVKAQAKGLFTPATKMVNIQETKFESLQLDPNTHACLMNNFLNYQNNAGHEVLQGTYLSNNSTNGKDCGGGTLILEKQQPIAKLSKTQKVTITKAPMQKEHKLEARKEIIATTSKQQNTKTSASLLNIIGKSYTSEASGSEEIIVENKVEESTSKQTELQVIPWLLVSRENKLVKKLITSNQSISIDLYDNGTIDNDTINVFDNNKLLINKKRLSYKAIHLDFNFSNSNPTHEVIIVAHNMGSVPPNTALLVYKDGAIRQELFITSTNKINAKLLIEYQPPKP
jgi:hypothetical protein